jgi:hypothetical protein
MTVATVNTPSDDFSISQGRPCEEGATGWALARSVGARKRLGFAVELDWIGLRRGRSSSTVFLAPPSAAASHKHSLVPACVPQLLLLPSIHPNPQVKIMIDHDQA